MGFFNRRSSPGRPAIYVSPAPPATRPINLLPRQAPYVGSALEANSDFDERGWPVRVAAVRMVVPGELEIALVVPDVEGGLRASLEALPGPTAVLDVVKTRLTRYGHQVFAQYFNEQMWAATESSDAWRYFD